jgi:hypothetical protein
MPQPVVDISSVRGFELLQFAAVIPRAARARIAIVFFIIFTWLSQFDALAEQNIVTRGLPFCKKTNRVAAEP